MEKQEIGTLYVRNDCAFSQLARQRVIEVARSFRTIRVLVRDQSEAASLGIRIPVTPTLVLADGARLTGTPSATELRRVFSDALGNTPPVPNKVWYLERNKVFAGVPREEIEKFAHLFYEHDYKAKEIVFSEGDLGDGIYLLKSGHVRLYRATEEGKEMARRRQEVETRIAGLAYGSVRIRLMHALRHLAREHGEHLENTEIRIPLRLSHQEIAQLIGTSRETCTVEIGKLQLAGIVRIDDE